MYWQPIEPGLGHVGTEFADLVVKTPERCADRHRRELAAGILVRPGHAGEAAIFFGKARVEHASEIDVTGRAAGADDDGLARADIRPRPLMVDRDPEHRAGVRSLPVDRGHSVLEQNLDTGFFGRDFERSHQAIAGGTGLLDRRIGRLAGVRHRPMHHRRVHFARHRISDGVSAKRIRRFVDKDNAVSDQPFEGGGTVVGEGANDFAIVVPVIREAVRPDHRPVRQIAEQKVRGILDPIFLLHAGPAAERNIAATDDGVTADILFSLDQDHRGSRLPRDNGGGKSGRARADHDDVGFAIPFHPLPSSSSSLLCLRLGSLEPMPASVERLKEPTSC